MLKILKTWFHPPYFRDDEDKTRSALVLSVILNTFTVALPIFIVAILLGGNTPRLERVVSIVALAWATIFMTRLIMFSGRVAQAGMIAVIVIFISTTLVVYNIGTIRAPATSVYILTIVTAGMTIGRRAIVWTAAACSTAILVFLIAERNGYLPVPDLTVSITQGTTFIGVFVIISFMLFLAVRSIDESLARVRMELAERRQAEATLQKFAARLEVLHEIDRGLLTARTHQEIAFAALARIRRLIPCPRASVSLLDVEKQEASFLARDSDESTPLPASPISFAEFGQQTVDDLLQNKPSIILDSLSGTNVTELDQRLAKIGIRSWVSLPLFVQGQLVGSLNLGRAAGMPFTGEEIEIARDIANLLALAIHQTSLHYALQEELAERKKLIAQLEASNTELERFTYTVSHDLRSPLVTIRGFLGMLVKDVGNNQTERINDDFQRIARATDKMDNLLSDLLELSRVGRIANLPENMDLGDVAREAIETLDARIRTGNVHVEIINPLPVVYGDRLRMREVFENLIDNAAKYMGEQPHPYIEIGVQPGEETVIYIRDNGLGIEPRFISKIFGLFEKLNPRSEGTGIGLALVKRIIEFQGGRIWAESEGLGKGSTFYFTIPDGTKA